MNTTHEKPRNLDDVLRMMRIEAHPLDSEPVDQLRQRAARVRLLAFEARPFGADAVMRARYSAEQLIANLRKRIRVEILREIGARV
jgi:hypothetical protein